MLVVPRDIARGFMMTESSVGTIEARGILVEWFDVVVPKGEEALSPQLVEEIEFGRPDFAARPGLIRKLLPVAVEPGTGDTSSGGSYLFDSFENAKGHLHWTHTDYRINGLLFAEQPWVANMRGFVGKVVGAHDFKPLATSHASQRIQVWQLKDNDVESLAAKAWPKVLRYGKEAGLASVWLGVDPSTQSLALVSVASRSADRSQRDYKMLRELNESSLVNETLPELTSAHVVVDKTMWVITIWLPPKDGKIPDGLWPNSPPLPGP
jgi:hypothetical protein